MRMLLRTVNLATILGLLVLTIDTSAQSQASTDAGQITALMAGLSDRSKTPAEVLDPNLDPSARAKSLQRLSAPHYKLSIVPTEGAPAIEGDSASLPVKVHFDSQDGNSLDTSTTAHFVKRKGTWYFSSFDFMQWPMFLILVLIGAILVGIGYAATILILRSKLVKENQLGLNGVKMFIPFYWPSLFRQVQ
jgi:hypothetical protein